MRVPNEFKGMTQEQVREHLGKKEGVSLAYISRESYRHFDCTDFFKRSFKDIEGYDEDYLVVSYKDDTVVDVWVSYQIDYFYKNEEDR